MSESQINYAAADESFGESLKVVREEKNFSQEALADAMQAYGYSFTQSTIYKIESSKRKVSVGEALALTKILDVPIERLALNHDHSDAARREEIKAQARHCVILVRDIFDYTADASGNFSHLDHLLQEYEWANPNKKYSLGQLEGDPLQIFKPIRDLDPRYMIEGMLRTARVDELVVALVKALGLDPDVLYDIDNIHKPEELPTIRLHPGMFSEQQEADG